MAYKITDTCNGCALCRRYCPVDAISGENKMLHVINAKRCIECGVCGWTCGQGAVIDGQGLIVEKVPRKKWPKPVINYALCTACSICVDVCGKNSLAISRPTYSGDLDVYAFLIDEKSCVGCGLCSQLCPMDIIAMEVPHD